MEYTSNDLSKLELATSIQFNQNRLNGMPSKISELMNMQFGDLLTLKESTILQLNRFIKYSKTL